MWIVGSCLAACAQGRGSPPGRTGGARAVGRPGPAARVVSTGCRRVHWITGVKESQAADGGRPPSGRRPSAVRRRFFLAFWLVLASANLSSATPTHCAPTPLVSRDPAALRPLVEAAAARHPLPALEPGAQVDWLMAILAVEMGPPPQGDPPGFAAVVYPAWQAGKALAACAGVDTTVGVAQVRPQTAAQIEAGW